MRLAMDVDMDALEQLAHLPADRAAREAGRLLEALAAQPAFLRAQILPLLREAAPAGEPRIASAVTSPGGGCSLQVFVWPAGARTPIHDHTSWGAYHCVVGSLFEERFTRLDGGEQPERAHLRAGPRRPLRRADGASTVGPYAEGIHRISNPFGRPAISVHLYGPRMGSLDGRDYDPSRDFVCDRYEPELAA